MFAHRTQRRHRQVTLDLQHYPQTEMRFPFACRTIVFNKKAKLRTGSYMRRNVSSVESASGPRRQVNLHGVSAECFT